MTRINSAIPVEVLTDEHLLAEHREIKRIPFNYFKAREVSLKKSKNLVDRIPSEFCLGKGHVLFFCDKLWFTFKRYKKIREECLKRGFIVEDYSANWDSVRRNLHFCDYTPTNTEKQLLIQRIIERIQLSNKEFFHYYGEKITKEEAINKLKIC